MVPVRAKFRSSIDGGGLEHVDVQTKSVAPREK